MEKAYEATAFCVYATFLCGAGRMFGVVFVGAWPFFLFKTARVLSRG